MWLLGERTTSKSELEQLGKCWCHLLTRVFQVKSKTGGKGKSLMYGVLSPNCQCNIPVEMLTLPHPHSPPPPANTRRQTNASLLKSTHLEDSAYMAPFLENILWWPQPFHAKSRHPYLLLLYHTAQRVPFRLFIFLTSLNFLNLLSCCFFKAGVSHVWFTFVMIHI